jgi:hypothetical protein
VSQPFNPQEHLIKLPKRVKDPETSQWVTRYDDYLEVKWRLCWFRDRYPHGRIETEEVCVDLDRVMSVEVTTTVEGKRQTQRKTGTGYARFKARVEDGEGGVATGYGTENAAEFADFVERAETRSIGRALAGLGIGTQFVGAELSEGEHIVDATVTTSAAVGNLRPSEPVNGNGHTPAPEADKDLEHPTEGHIAALANLALTECHEDKEVYYQRIRTTMGLKPAASVAPRLLTRTMSMAQYMDVFAYYRRLESQLAKSQKEVTSGNATPETQASPAPAAPTGKEPPVDPSPAVPPSPGELSSASGPDSEADAAERDRIRLRAEVAAWELRVPPEEVEHVIQHNAYSKARALLWKCRRQEVAA